MRNRIKQLKHIIDSHLNIVKLSSFTLNAIRLKVNNERQLNFQEKVQTSSKTTKISIMTNTKISTSNFVDVNFVKQHKLNIMILIKFIKLRLIDDKFVLNIIRMIRMKFQLKKHVNEIWCLITTLKKFDLILNMSWLKQHSMNISCENKSIIFASDHYLENCIHNYQSTIVYSLDIKKSSDSRSSTDANIVEITATAFMKMTTQDKNQVIAMWLEHFEMLDRLKKQNKYMLASPFAVNIAAISAEDFEKFFNKADRIPLIEEQLKKRISMKFHKYVKTFSLTETNKLSSRREWDHRIDLRFEATSFAKKTYDLSRDQVKVVKKYVDDMLDKSFIRSSSFEYAASILVVKKFEDDLRVCVDYRALNVLTIKNRNALSLIRETLIRLCSAKMYSKFDIITAFNEVRIKKENEKKTTFLTRYELFEYVIMSFELCNASEIFQAFINVTLREYLDDFCSEYVDDVIVYSDIRDDHVNHVFKILVKLKKAKLYLNIDKFEFFVTSIKYLELIITTDEVKMNLKKMNVIVNWKSSKCVKNVQIFLDFANFYRKFILEYFRIITSLSRLTKSEKKDFAFSWSSDDFEKIAFRDLKLTFTIASILQHFNSDSETWIKIDVFDFVVATMLNQIKSNDKLYSVVYMFKKMSSTKCNYEIYDKELLIIIKTFEKWRSKCAKTSMKNLIKILTNHKNLKHFMTSKQLNRRQVRWAKFLIEFNFKITYRSKVQDIKSNNLIRRSQNLFEKQHDEHQQFNHRILLKSHYFEEEVRNAISLASLLMNESQKKITILATMLYELSEEKLFANEKSDEESFAKDVLEKRSKIEKSKEKSTVDSFMSQFDIIELIKTTYSNDIILQRIMKSKRNELRRISIKIIIIEIRLKLDDCEIKDDLFWMKDKLYVFQDDDVFVVILKQIHELSFEKHASKVIIYDRVFTHYFWSRMTDTIARYVKSYHQCRKIKTYRKNKQKLLKSLSISNRYFQNISINFITLLSICKRHDKNYEHIMIIVDKLFKKKKYISLDSLKVSVVVQTFIEWMWREESYSNFIISNRDIQFVFYFWQRLCERIDTHFKLFIVWHSETNDQTENVNADFKQYLRVYVNFNQDDWYDHLSIAKFESNSNKSASSELKSFLVIKDYISKSDLELSTSITDESVQRREMKNANKFIVKQKKLKEYLRNELKWSQIKQKKYVNVHRTFASKFRMNDMIMLNARYLKIMRLNKNLDYKNLESFKVVRMINNCAYELELSQIIKKCFSIFHSWFLHFDDENLMLEQKDEQSASVATNNNEDLWKMNEILNFKIDKRMNDSTTKTKSCLKYRVRWTNQNNLNTTFDWYIYINLKTISYLMIDFHHKYSNKTKSHAIFVQFANWTSSTN